MGNINDAVKNYLFSYYFILFHYLYSFIISRKFIIKFFNKCIYCICMESFKVFIEFSQIIIRKRKLFKKLHDTVH